MFSTGCFQYSMRNWIQKFFFFRSEWKKRNDAVARPRVGLEILGVTRNEQIITTRDGATTQREKCTIPLVGSAPFRPVPRINRCAFDSFLNKHQRPSWLVVAVSAQTSPDMVYPHTRRAYLILCTIFFFVDFFFLCRQI